MNFYVSIQRFKKHSQLRKKFENRWVTLGYPGLPWVTLGYPGLPWDSWEVADAFAPSPGHSSVFTVRWQFAPGAWLKRHSERQLELRRGDVSMWIEVDDAWDQVAIVEPVESLEPAQPPKRERAASLEGIVSPAFRKTVRAPYLKLVANLATIRSGPFVTIFRRR